MLGVILGWNVFPAGCACERGRKQSSLTLNGEPGYEPGCQFHALSRESVFFSCRTVQQFFPPSHPLVSYCLEFILEVYQHFLVVFSPFLSTLIL